MKAAVYKAKKTYIKFGDKVYQTNNKWSDFEFQEVEKDFNFKDLGDFDTIQDAYYYFVGLEIIERNKRKKMRSEQEKAESEKWEEMKKGVIPATLENIAFVLRMLNKSNWGTWELPSMTISYTACQYDCDGIQATTIILDEPVDGYAMYKVGGKIGHLNNYKPLR